MKNKHIFFVLIAILSLLTTITVSAYELPNDTWGGFLRPLGASDNAVKVTWALTPVAVTVDKVDLDSFTQIHYKVVYTTGLDQTGSVDITKKRIKGDTIYLTVERADIPVYDENRVIDETAPDGGKQNWVNFETNDASPLPYLADGPGFVWTKRGR